MKLGILFTPTNGQEGEDMKAIGIILIVLGVLGIVMGLMMFGDIGLACIVGALSALLSGVGFLLTSRRV